MALFSCFDHAYSFLILRRTWLRGMWSAIIFFGALIPAATVLASAHLRSATSGAALLACLFAVLFSLRRPLAKALRILLLGFVGASLAGMVSYFSVPLLPPVPIQCVESAMGSAVIDRQLLGKTNLFAAGSDRVYAWFAVAASAHYRQMVTFIWQCGGKRIGQAFDTEVVGGRQAGFRTWGYFPTPWPGEWRGDLVTDANQLIARESFKVCQGNPLLE
jgi:hypothetical protein